MLKEKGVKHILGPTYRPQAQGMVERVNGTLKRLITAWMTKQKSNKYLEDLPSLVSSYNHTVHSTTGITPARALKGKYADIVAFRIKSKAEVKIAADKRAFPKLEPNDRVRVAREAYDTEYRKAKQTGVGKLAKGTAARWSTKVYTIERIVNRILILMN